MCGFPSMTQVSNPFSVRIWSWHSRYAETENSTSYIVFLGPNHITSFLFSSFPIFCCLSLFCAAIAKYRRQGNLYRSEIYLLTDLKDEKNRNISKFQYLVKLVPWFFTEQELCNLPQQKAQGQINQMLCDASFKRSLISYSNYILKVPLNPFVIKVLWGWLLFSHGNQSIWQWCYSTPMPGISLVTSHPKPVNVSCVSVSNALINTDSNHPMA